MSFFVPLPAFYVESLRSGRRIALNLPMKDIVMTRRQVVLTALGVPLAVSNAAPLDELASLSLTEARGLVQSGAVSPLELVDACYKSIVSLNPKLNAYITVDIEGARKQAHRAERVDRSKRGILYGIPIGLKDNINTAGIKTTAASGVLAHNIPSRDAYVVQQLKAAGAIILGKHNLHEFAHGTTSAISYFGGRTQPVELGVQRRRLVWRLCRSNRDRNVLRSGWHGYWRLRSYTRSVLRSSRLQTDLRSC
jgi:hypothetical protein